MKNSSTATPETWRDVVARHFLALPEDRPVSLAEFVDEVQRDLEDYWPAPATFDDAAWDEAKARMDAAQLRDWTAGELREAFGR